MTFEFMGKILAPDPLRERLPEEKVRRYYPKCRWRVMESTFIGYATFYLIRNNLSVVSKDLQGLLHYSKSDIGSILAISAAAYGIGKFLLGAISDRSNPRKFMALGLLLTAMCNFAFGAVQNLNMHLLLWALNGFFQGMGWPPCGRSMGHWFSERERGLTFSIWNTSHNVGGGVAGMVAAWAVTYCGGWQYAFYVPGVMALVGAGYLLLRLCDTPQSMGLPPIEEYNDDYTEQAGVDGNGERDLSTKELFIDFVLMKKYIWLLAFANFFAYVSRYSMLDWGPMYLREMKGAGITGGGFAVLVTEFGGIPSTILMGWISDRTAGRRGMVATLCMVPVLGAFITILFTPPNMIWLDMAMLTTVGMFVYPVINLIVILALDLTSKKAIGTVAGFIGLLGYIGRTVEAKGFGWMLDYFGAIYGKHTAWQIVIFGILICTLLAMILLAFTWKQGPRSALPKVTPETAIDEALIGT